MEALASGVPLVQPDASSFQEIIATSQAGILVPPNNPAALAAAWHDLLTRPERLKELGENGRRAAERSYSVEAMRDRFLVLAQPLVP